MIKMDERTLAWALHDLGEMYESFDNIRYATRCLDEVIANLDDEDGVKLVKWIQYIIGSSTDFCVRTISSVEKELHPEGINNLTDYLYDESDEDSLFDFDECEEIEEEDDEEFEEDDEVEDE